MYVWKKVFLLTFYQHKSLLSKLYKLPQILESLCSFFVFGITKKSCVLVKVFTLTQVTTLRRMYRIRVGQNKSNCTELSKTVLY